MPWEFVVPFILMRLADPISLTSFFSYAPAYVRHLGAQEEHVAAWVGVLLSTYIVAQACFIVKWSRVSDRLGRKPVLMTGMIFTALAHLIWGFAPNLWTAAFSRLVNGVFNGNTAIFITSMTELVPARSKKLRPIIQSINPAVFFFGSSIGPLVGLFYNLGNGDSSSGSLFAKFPALPPSLVVVTVTLTGLFVGWMFVPETHASFRDDRDRGIEVGKMLIYRFRLLVFLFRRSFNPDLKAPETVRFVKPSLQVKKAAVQGPSLRSVMTPQNVYNLISHMLMALVTMSTQEFIPIFLEKKKQEASDITGFLRYTGGLGWSTQKVSSFGTGVAILTLIMQVFVYPRIGKSCDHLITFRTTMFMYPIILILFPFTVYFDSERARDVYIAALWSAMAVTGTFAFPSSRMLITMAAGERALSTVNGAITLSATIGRFIGPLCTGAADRFGVTHRFTAAAFILLCCFAIIGASSSFALDGEETIDDIEPIRSEPTGSDLEAGERNDETASLLGPSGAPNGVSQAQR